MVWTVKVSHENKHRARNEEERTLYKRARLRYSNMEWENELWAEEEIKGFKYNQTNVQDAEKQKPFRFSVYFLWNAIWDILKMKWWNFSSEECSSGLLYSWQLLYLSFLVHSFFALFVFSTLLLCCRIETIFKSRLINYCTFFRLWFYGEKFKIE